MTYKRTANVRLNQQPLGGPILTKPFLAALLVFLLSVPLIIWRFAASLAEPDVVCTLVHVKESPDDTYVVKDLSGKSYKRNGRKR